MNISTENLSSTLLISFLFILIIYCAKWVINKRKTLNIFKDHGIPNPPSNILTGNLEIIGDPIKVTDKWLKEYGNVFGYFMGNHPVLCVKDLEILQSMFIKNFSNFKERPHPGFVVKPLCYGLASINGPRWKATRQVLSPTFSNKKMKLMNNLMSESVSTLTEIIGEKCAADEPFDIYAMAQGLTMDVIGKCALALKVDCQRNPKDKLLVASKGFLKHTFNASVMVAMIFPPVTKIIEYINKYMEGGQVTDFIVKNLKNVISYRRKNTTKKFVDMLQLMLDAAESDEHGNRLDVASKKSLTDDEIIGNGLTFIIAGFETTANALGYTFYLLAKYQNIQDKLRQEIDEHLSEDSENSNEIINSLNYLDQVFNESLRIYPPVVYFISRMCASTIVINGVTIPKGVEVEAPVYQIHHDPKLWPNPEEFDPSRFSPENKKNIHPMAFIPFGIGPRNCVGMRFAQMEAKMAIARVIHKYKLVFCEKTEDPLQIIVPGITANPANGVILKAIKIT